MFVMPPPPPAIVQPAPVAPVAAALAVRVVGDAATRPDAPLALRAFAAELAATKTEAAILPRMETEERAYWVAWARVPGVGPVRMGRLVRSFGTLREAWGASLAALRAGGLEERVAANAVATFAKYDPRAAWERLAQGGIAVYTQADAAYPRLLREIPHAPALLFVRGSLAAADDRAVAIVGTRRATAYGREVARQLAAGLAEAGVTVVSGLARGIDGTAHTAALDAGGRTLAVLAHGLDTVYPREHAALMARIADGGGAAVSEYAPGVRPDAPNFPARNRIISGLALGTVIVEADRRSGAMITADFAADQGREVLAVPGSILNPVSAGCHALLRDGAHLVAGAGDILAALQLGDEMEREQAAPRTAARAAAQAEVQTEMVVPAAVAGMEGAGAVLHALSAEPQHIDDLLRESGMAISDLNVLLVQLQLTGAVRSAGPQMYVRA